MTVVDRGGLDVQYMRPVTDLLSRSVRSLARARPADWCVLVSAGLSPLLLTGAWLIGGAVQPVPYSPVRQTVSVLAGYGAADRWIVTSALFVIGACYAVMAAGLTELPAAARIGLLVSGVTAFGIATSPEPAQGTTPQHVAFTTVGAVAIAVWPAFVGRRDRYSSVLLGVRVSATVTAVFVALLGWFTAEAWDGSAVGLAERTASSIQICWPFVVALALRRTRNSAA
ncbi:MAG: putative integral rane protein, partial [Pseudonocardiales bacterium]|nr:putative integral rane protein [Pseudonocardiales bacterium]